MTLIRLGESWHFNVMLFFLISSLHCLLFGLVLNRWYLKPLLCLLFIATAIAQYFMSRYMIFLDPHMLRNVFNTNVMEARELLSFGLLISVLIYGGLPSLIICLLNIKQRSWKRAVMIRVLFLLGTLILISIMIASSFQHLSALMRNQKEMRYLITPGNFIASTMRVLNANAAIKLADRIPIGTDAHLDASWSRHKKPALLVVVAGETARAKNWGLNGYDRQTTPQLAALDVLNFSNVTSCGTNTEVSLPCMFSSLGRRQYDEELIRKQESLLHVLERSGFDTVWIDNQGGCKGICDGLELRSLEDSGDPEWCDGERCLDEILLKQLKKEVKKTKRNIVLVLHPLGNHGPAYFRRYPPSFQRFNPACEVADLNKCSQQQIVNSYDNALLYTDHLLAETIKFLQQQNSHDSALMYVSDHGESLGENGIYLHGMPYAIAPEVQIKVPMIMWFSQGFSSNFNIDLNCLKKRTHDPISHDHLFHTVLGALKINTGIYEKPFDLTATCRNLP